MSTIGKRKIKDTIFDESTVLYNAAYRDYVDHMEELYESMFDWRGVPDGVDERFSEMGLLRIVDADKISVKE